MRLTRAQIAALYALGKVGMVTLYEVSGGVLAQAESGREWLITTEGMATKVVHDD